MSRDVKNPKTACSMSVERVLSLIQKKHSNRVDWIVITSSESVCARLRKVKHKDFEVKCVLSLKTEDGQLVIDPSDLRRAAGQSWLFNLVFDIDLPSNHETVIDKCLKGLKDLGFCKIYNFHEKNHEALLEFCANYNVYYEGYYIN